MLQLLTLNTAAGAAVAIHEESANPKRGVISVKGLAGIGPLRASKRFRPSAHGSLNETKYEEGRTITVEGEVMGTSSSDAYAEFRAMTAPWVETLDIGAALMKWKEPGGLELQRLVKLDGEVEPLVNGVAPRLVYQALFFGEDPRAYSQTLTTQTGAGISGTAPEEQFSKAAALVGLAVDSAHIYWANGTAIGRAAIGGGTVEPEWVKTSATPASVAVNASNIFWTSSAGIGRATLAGATIENEWIKAATAMEGPTPRGIKALAVDAAHIYWQYATGLAGVIRVGRAAIGGTTIEPKWIPTGGNDSSATTAINSTGLAVDAGHVYWPSGEGRIARAAIGGGTIELGWIAAGGAVIGVAVSASFIYWTNQTSVALERATIAGAEQRPLISPTTSPGLVAIDASFIYWNNLTAGYIARGAIAGAPYGSSSLVAQAGNRPTPLVLKINGPIINPVISRKSDGSRIALGGEVSAGNYLEVDCAARTVKLNGSSNALSMVNAQATNWAAFLAPASPASETYFLSGLSATAATLEVLSRSAYA